MQYVLKALLSVKNEIKVIIMHRQRFLLILICHFLFNLTTFSEIIDLRFVPVYNDGENGGEFGVKIQIREQNGGAFGMGSSQLVFSFDTTSLKLPSIVHAFRFDKEPYYDTMSLELIVSTHEWKWSINYTGDNNSGEIVMDWTDVVIFNFTIMDSTGSASLSWNYDSTLVEVYDNNGNYDAVNGELIGMDYLLSEKILRPEPPVQAKWIRTGGPNGGTGYDIRIHPDDKNIMFVTDDPSGVNKSYDAGESWVQRNKGISKNDATFGNGAPIFSLSIDPGNPNIVWAGTQSMKGVYKSEDHGETWTEKVNGIPEGDEISFRGFAVHPQNSDIVLAASDIFLGLDARPGFQLVRGKIYKTVNGGESWYPVWEGENCARVLIYDYLHPDTIYCSTGIFDRTANNIDFDRLDPGGEGILKSTDGGETWYRVNNGLENLYIGFLEMHPTDPRILYAAAGGVISQKPFLVKGGIYKTVDGGEHWVKVLEDNSSFTVVTVSRSNTDILYAGDGGYFYRSSDAGRNWKNMTSENQGVWGPPGIWGGVPISAVVDPDNPDIVFVNSYQGGNYKSVDGGRTWINSSKGYSGARVNDISMNPQHPEKIYAACFSGPFRSHTGGEDWEGMKYGDANVSGHWYTIAVNPALPDQLLMSENNQGYILKSDNAGLDWQIVFKHPEVDAEDNSNMHGFACIEYARSNSDYIYAGMARFYTGGSTDPMPESSHGVFRSTDGGTTWQEKNNGLASSGLSICDIAVHPTNPQIAYAGTMLDGVYKTEDGGESWARKSNGLGYAEVRALAIDPLKPEVVYAGSGDGKGLYKSTDGAESWQEMNEGIDIICPSYLNSIGRTITGITFDDPLTKLKAYGSSVSIPWTKIVDIVIDPTNSEKVIVADNFSGIYYTDNGGEQWWIINEGLPALTVTSLAISDDGKVLYAGTTTSGVCKIILSGNLPPDVSRSYPSVNDTIRIFQGDSVTMGLEAFDMNGDTISYKWYLDENLIIGQNTDEYQFITDNNFFGPYVIKVICSDDDTSKTTIWIVQVSERPLSHISEDETIINECEIFPNPTNDYLNVRFKFPSSGTIEVFSSSGKLVNLKSFDHSMTITDIRINGMPGAYIVKVSTEKFQVTKKLILTDR